jgi:hypothetical protein
MLALYATRGKPINAAIYKGANRLKKLVEKILESCPRSKDDPRIVLAGYSLGAWAVNKWLYANVDFWPWIRAVELYGDPLWRRKGNDYLNNSFIDRCIDRFSSHGIKCKHEKNIYSHT